MYGIMQMLIARFANSEVLDMPDPRGVVDLQDALDAVLQVATVLDEQIQSGVLPVHRGVHAGAMLMIVRDYLRPLPAGLSHDGHDRLTEDLQELVEVLREARSATGLHG